MATQNYRHHIYEKQGGPKSIELKEIGPRFELRLFQVVTMPFRTLFTVSFLSRKDAHILLENLIIRSACKGWQALRWQSD